MLPAKRQREGFALLLVLGFLVLMTTLIIALLIGATSNYSQSKIYAQGAATKELSESAVNLVIGSIRQATTLGSTFAWASQPGMIRTYGTTTAPSGAPYQFYKLYSSDQPVLSSTSTTLTSYDPSTDINATWDTEAPLYTDLNSPVTLSNGDLEFPIIDPRAYASTASNTVPGFSYSSSIGVNTIDGVVTPTTGNATSQRLPMPVKWIYVLEDGTLTTPTGISGTKATWTGGSNPPSSSNKIVGRIAYWTDDDTNKVNINTAGGDLQNLTTGPNAIAGSFWDLPHVNSKFDRNLGTSQPFQYEFQRYPGHPSTVSLAEAFPPATAPTTRAQIVALTPRLGGTGSSGGTVSVTGGSVPALTWGTSRLYATTDEFYFQAASATPPTARTPNQVGSATPASLVSQIEMEKSFLTAHSRAPDLNLFGRPRVCIWPISSTNDSNHRTGSDNLIAYCSTIGPASSNRSYYFQRQDSNNQSTDFTLGRNQSIYSYLQNLTGSQFPGFDTPSGGFTSKYTSLERDQILTEIYDYIRCVNLFDPTLANQSGGVVYSPSPAITALNNWSKLSLATGQVIPIRITTSNGTTQGFGRMNTICEAALLFFSTQALSTTNGSVTTYTPSAMRAVLLFAPFSPSLGFTTLYPNYTVRISNTAPTTSGGSASSPFSSNLTAGSTSLQFWGSDNQVTCPITTGDIFWGGALGVGETFQSTHVFYSSTAKSIPASNPPQQTPPATYPTTRLAFATSFTPTCDPGGNYPFISQEIPITSGITNFAVSGTLYASIYANNGTGTAVDGLPAPGQLIQTIPFTFSGTYPVPNVPLDPSQGNIPALTSAMDFSYRLAGSKITVGTTTTTYGGIQASSFSSTSPYYNSYLTINNFIGGPSDYDTVIGVEPGTSNSSSIAGDMRLIAATPSVPSTWFTTHPSGSTLQLYDMRTSENNAYPGSDTTGWSLTSGLSYGSLQGLAGNAPPLFPSNGYTKGALTSGGTTGDWDNGIGCYPDGPYINKSDDGTSALTTNLGGQFGSSVPPYFGNSTEALNTTGTGSVSLNPTLFSPNRQMASAVQFGSLSTGVIRQLPWQTLLFHPDPSGTHPGTPAPKDYLLLDLFQMPVVEPYAISEPLSTAGRINMNYRIAPFSYIKRETALMAAMASDMVMAIPNSAVASYKNLSTAAVDSTTTYRYPINTSDTTGTLSCFENRFNHVDPNDSDNRGLFVSPAEICDIPLVPADGTTTASTMTTSGASNYWSSYALTGDNTKEAPYNHLYPLLTTQSNTYTVHFRVQALTKVPVTAANIWDESVDHISGEYRGATTIERYIDPSDSRLVSSNASQFVDPDTQSLASLYKYRIVGTRKFSP